jgi:ubiquinone/menaquinone biosynthesis C-methylase UbiE
MPAWDKKRKVMRHYSRIATTYDLQYAEEQEEKMSVALSDVHLGRHSLILDLGCGTGLLFNHLGNSVGLLAGIDLSRDILREAKKRADQLANVALLRADADCTPFRNRIFHAVFAITLLQNSPNPARTLEEVKRIARENASIILTALKKEFTLEATKQLVGDAGLSIETVKTDIRLKGYVIKCKNIPSSRVHNT